MLTDIEMMTISNLDFLHYMTAVSHEMSDEPYFGSGAAGRLFHILVMLGLTKITAPAI